MPSVSELEASFKLGIRVEMQSIITIVIILIALGYAGWRIYRIVKGHGDPCEGCQLKKNCKKFCQSKN